MMIADVERAYAALTAKSGPYTTLHDYYHNQAPVVYTNKRLATIFANLDARFTENWCAVVIDAAADRINLRGFRTDSASDQTAVDALWTSLDLSILADDVHEDALLFGEAYVICWPNALGEPRAYYHDPRMAHIFYSDEDPYVVDMACKWYDDKLGFRRLVLYYPATIERYVSTKKADHITSWKAFQPDSSAPSDANPFGQVPVFQFRTRRTVRSELENVLPLQNGVNKTLADMMVAAEYGAARQRYVISNADTSQLRNAPNEIWAIPAGDGVGQPTQVGEFTPTDLQNYLDAVDHMSRAIAVISRTPKHFFFGQGGDPSGEALMAMEAPLIAKCRDFSARFAVTWRQMMVFLAQLAGTQLESDDVAAEFDDPATPQPRTQAEIRKLCVEAGIPLVTVLKREGWTDAEIAEMAREKQAEADRQQVSLASAMIEAQRRMDQGGEGALPDAPQMDHSVAQRQKKAEADS